MKIKNWYFSICLTLFLTLLHALQVSAQTCTDPNLFADECDWDGDGVLNVADLDDDNDGVLDTAEQDCFLSNNLTDGLAAGFHPMDTWLLTHGVRIRHIETINFTANTTTFRVLNHPSYPALGDADGKMIWNGNGISIAYFAPDGITQQTTNTFSIWSDPFFIGPPNGLVRVIARDINGNDILDRFDPDGSEHLVNLTHTGGVAIHEVVLAFNSSAFDVFSQTGSCLDRDTDNDTSSDRFDLDSDADGCSDAFEAGATTDISINFQFTDATGDPDGLSPSADPGGDGVTDYISTYDAEALDNTINNCPTVLSVELIQFEAKPLFSWEVQLTWQTQVETDLSHIGLERSVNGVDWEGFHILPAKGNTASPSEYNWVDSRPLGDVSFYRLKFIQANGLYTFSGVRKVMFSEKLALDLYPNPFTHQITLEGEAEELHKIKVFDLTGKALHLQIPILYEGENKAILDFSKLGNGCYLIQTPYAAYKVFKQ